MNLQLFILSNMPQLQESIQQARNPKATGQMERPGRLTHEDLPMLSVRRMLPLECEILQGFPPEWTNLDTEV